MAASIMHSELRGGEFWNLHKASRQNFRFNKKLRDSHLPKLLLYANPGGLITAEGVEWCRQNLKNLNAVDIGKGIHFVQEDNPHLIGSELAGWYKRVS